MEGKIKKYQSFLFKEKEIHERMMKVSKTFHQIDNIEQNKLFTLYQIDNKIITPEDKFKFLPHSYS